MRIATGTRLTEERRLGVDKTTFKFVKGSRTERDELLSRAAEVVDEAMG